ncbi:hypothetical protein [Mycolicibacterium neoaurum]|uniref:hypothetical protein n=1 Tax=Mycolicibacterium neoaurum TaxID=1795 RepID=UPI001F4C6DA5|nr:hypothetical protein [Mycolicibacterium neoaurum]
MFVAKWYTRASRVRIVIAKFDGRWKLPGGPYPIPELVALIGGIMAMLFLLPRIGQPILTAAVGISATAIAVGVMRKMPYSPVALSTRIHRVVRLYTRPTSLSTGDELTAVNTVSTVRPQVEVLDVFGDSYRPHAAPGRSLRTTGAPAHQPDESVELFSHHSSSTASELFN